MVGGMHGEDLGAQAEGRGAEHRLSAPLLLWIGRRTAVERLLVVGVDRSTRSRAAADWAADEALLRELRLRTVHGSPPPRYDGTTGTGHLVCGRRAYVTGRTGHPYVRLAEDVVLFEPGLA
ncbi:universal stress protein [Streptomyces sp. NBC_01236]|uniref:universal stress protein n=1 Tax=Streptomyces sp. NBC_01236 TaxID=2903789 RepID=UPI002E12B6AC|nr:universal stress protein [Streptomyces sp. NBC_01236]